MEIKSKFNVGDLVYFIHDNQVKAKVISTILFGQYSEEKVEDRKKNYSFMRPNFNQCVGISYKFYKDMEKTGVFQFNSWGALLEVELEQDRLFKTKQELLESL